MSHDKLRIIIDLELRDGKCEYEVQFGQNGFILGFIV